MRAVYFRVIIEFVRSPFKILSISGIAILLNFFLWLNPNTSIPDSGFADLSVLFTHLPWILIIVITSLTMTFAVDDFKDDLEQLIFSKPISTFGYWAGHFMAIFTIVTVFVGLTVANVLSVRTLAIASEHMDYHQVVASYIGVVLLSVLLINIGLYAASITSQNASAMLLGLLLCFILYGVPSLVGNLLDWHGSTGFWLDYLSLEAHLEFFNRGILKWNSIIYFLSLSTLLAAMSINNVQKRIISN